MPRGQLRVYLGAAPGVGKTYAMLGEGQRARDRGTDVVVGFVETHGRPRTAAMLSGLEVVPRQTVSYRGTALTEMDVDAVLARRPQVALVDELAHTNAPGSRNEKRWQDVEELLGAGIKVVTTVNIQHLESLNDVVAKITGVVQRETVPDAVVRAADQVELVDQTPEALRRRMAHGNVYAPDKVDAALSNYFRVGNLTALRELALLWLADRVDEGLQRYRDAHHIEGTWETRERVVVGLTGGPEGDTLIRRAARIAARGGADLLAVHVARPDGLTGARPEMLARQRALVESLGGTYHQVIGDNVGQALIDFAQAENATQLVLGSSRRSRSAAFLTGPGIGATATRLSGSIDVHIVTHEQSARRRGLLAPYRGLGVRRRLAGAAVALTLLPLLTLLLANTRHTLNLSSDLLTFLLGVVVVALVGGAYPGVAAAVAASLLLNYYFTPPLYTFTISQLNNVLALVAFVVVAAAVSWVVELAARRTALAARASTESRTLATLAGSVLRGESLPGLLDRARETFGLASVTLLERVAPPGSGGELAGAWAPIASSGADPCRAPGEGDTEIPVDDRLALAVRGRPLPARDRRLLAAFATQAAAALERQRLEEAAGAAGPLAAAEQVRTELVGSIGRRLRAALAAIDEARPAVPGGARAELAALGALAGDLVDLNRLQTGARPVRPQSVSLSTLLPSAAGPALDLDIPAGLPDVSADPALLGRLIANLAADAVAGSPPRSRPLLAASAHGDRVEVRMVDRRPATGRPPEVGQALARALAEVLGSPLVTEETPGGGSTSVLSLPRAGQPAAPLPVGGDGGRPGPA